MQSSFVAGTVLLGKKHFGKLGFNLNDLVVKVLDSQSKSLMVKNISEYQEFEGT